MNKRKKGKREVKKRVESERRKYTMKEYENEKYSYIKGGEKENRTKE
jgi:hypothetical protein